LKSGDRYRGTWKKGAALLAAAALGFFFLRDGTARMTALAARPAILSFLSGETADSLGTGILKQASGIRTLSVFLGEAQAVPVRAETDPAYGEALREHAEGQGEGGFRLQALADVGGAEQAALAEAETTAAGDGAAGAPPAEGTAEGSGETEAGGAAQAAPPAAMAATEVRGTTYTAEQLADFEFVKKNFFYVHKSTTVYPEQLDASVLLGKDMSLPESGEPQILLFHTHGSEAFSDSEEGNADMTVVGVGNYLAELLSTQYGIQVIHNTEVFPYSDSYSLALDMIEQTLAEHPSIQVTIDLHRDSGGHDVVDIGGKPTAPIMLFNGMCQTPDGPLENVGNPYLLDNLAFNFQMKLKGEAYYPGLMLRTFLKAYRYNQHVLPRATLIEVGTENNTFEEARNAMEPLADILYKVLRNK
jgi:stage II sporulation protein P